MTRVLGAVLCAATVVAAQATTIDVDALWNYSDPAASEARFRDAQAGAEGDDALILRTQIARALGLRKRFDDAARELDAVQARLEQAGPEVAVRHALERGRWLRSSGRPADSVVWFERAFERAQAARLERLAGDALHMVALAVATLDERIAWNRRTIDYARQASDPKARGWEAPALNNIGSDLREAGRFDESLAAFREALAAYERTGRAEGIRVARWQVANVLRLLGRRDEALAQQLALERDAAAANAPDPYVYDELALLHAAGGDADAAERARARARELRGGR
jgi:tetratricopeptide (TPR) repeat protein